MRLMRFIIAFIIADVIFTHFWVANLFAATPDFARDVRPILSEHCFACHGPDEASREAGLRLDTAEGIASVSADEDSKESEFLARINSEDSDVVMPPPNAHKTLADEQKQILERWIRGGGNFDQHWSFAPIRKPKSGSERSIDYWIDRAISSAGLKPNPVAEKRALVRRICLDLLGLPPTADQVADFLNDSSVDAIANLVDRLQQSPHYGEHMARHWLDLVRYGDTHGLHLDNYREMWPYRDWVINAFNDNMAFDRFIIEQLAGDMLPNATDQQKVASGFNRLNVTTNEGGSIYDEVFARNVIDRTDAFGTVFLGLTTGCAVCHDHKFDPITQRDYYSLAGYFNSLDGRAMDENIKDPAPVLRVLNAEQKELVRQYDSDIVAARVRMSGPIESVDQAQEAWAASLGGDVEPNFHTLVPNSVASSAKVEMKVAEDQSILIVGEAAAKDTTTIIADLPSGKAWQTLRLEALVDKPDSRVGASTNGNVVLTEITMDTSDPDDPNMWNPVPIKHAIADIEQSDGAFAVSYAIDEKLTGNQGWGAAGHQHVGPRTAWFVVPALMLDAQTPKTKIRVQLKYQSVFAKHQFRRVRLTLSDSPPTVRDDQRIRFSSMFSIGPFPVESARPAYYRTFASRGKPFKLDEEFRYGEKTYRWQKREDISPVEVARLETIPDRASATLLHQGMVAPKAQKISLLFGGDDGHVVFLNGKRVAIKESPGEHKPLEHEYELDLKKGDNRLYIKTVHHGGIEADGKSEFTFAYRSPSVATPEQVVELARRNERSAEDQQSLTKYYRSVVCLHPDWLALVDHAKGLQTARKKTVESAATTLVWKELEKPRVSRILQRGQYDQPGEVVPRKTPDFLPQLTDSEVSDRLGLARWLCSDQHPLTARVAVNRFWQQLFGSGLVSTSEDFGNQGELPSHPELLDFLASEFRDGGWNVNALIKMMITSDAYLRSSRVTKQMAEIDPKNRLFARGPRHRLDAEVLRDQALAVSGLLNTDVGGPSVKPPQPDGLWYAVGFSRSNTAKFTADTEPNKIYRRSAYIFWKRTSSPPMMSTLDAPSRENCTARRERTNTPLQALLLLNEVQYIQAAKKLAEKVLARDSSEDENIKWLFERVVIRPPNDVELTELRILLRDLTEDFTADQESTKKLTGGPDAKKAAWTVLSNTLLNLDEVVTK